MKSFVHKILKPGLIFFVILIILGLAYNYHTVAFYKPLGIHQWRNSVSAAFPVNYYYGGNFFKTQTNALLADDLSSDVAIVEFPLIYYIVSVLYRLFGVNELWFKLFQVLIGYVGLLCLFKASYHFTRDWFYAAFIPLIIFTSPIYVFYLNNFIPDSVALSIALIGFYYFTRYMETRRLGPWMISMLFFTLAGLTKTSSLLPYLALGGVAMIDLLRRFGNTGNRSVFDFRIKYIIPYFTVILLVVAWYAYAKVYSDIHAGSISAVEIRPIWKLDKDTISATFKSMQVWYRNGTYHAKYFLILSALLFLGTVFMRKMADPFLYSLNILVVLGALSFSILFFRSMRNHDYYQINNLFLFIPLYLTVFSIILNSWPQLYRSIWMKMLLSGVILLLVLNAGEHMRKRYSDRDMHYVSSSETLRMFNIEEYLNNIGITREDKVYCTPDRSMNISLYLTNRKGLTDFSPLSKLTLQERLERMKGIGIEYVILGSREPYLEEENLDEMLGQKIGEIGGTEIFRLE